MPTISIHLSIYMSNTDEEEVSTYASDSDSETYTGGIVAREALKGNGKGKGEDNEQGGQGQRSRSRSRARQRSRSRSRAPSPAHKGKDKDKGKQGEAKGKGKGKNKDKGRMVNGSVPHAPHSGRSADRRSP